MIDLEQAKSYLRVEYDDDDPYIQSLIQVAYGYMEDGITNFSTKMKNERFDTKADIVCLALVQSMYDERYMLGNKLEVNYVIQSMMNQMEYGYV